MSNLPPLSPEYFLGTQTTLQRKLFFKKLKSENIPKNFYNHKIENLKFDFNDSRNLLGLSLLCTILTGGIFTVFLLSGFTSSKDLIILSIGASVFLLPSLVSCIYGLCLFVVTSCKKHLYLKNELLLSDIKDSLKEILKQEEMDIQLRNRIEQGIQTPEIFFSDISLSNPPVESCRDIP